MDGFASAGLRSSSRGGRHPWQPSGGAAAASPPQQRRVPRPHRQSNFYWPFTEPRDAAMDLASIADQMKMSREHALLGNYEAS